jgi:Cytochrome P460
MSARKPDDLMATKSLVLFGFVYLAAASVAIYGQQSPRNGPQRDGPEYDGMRLVRPVDYREWPFLGSGLGLTYDNPNAANAAPPFTNVFVNPSSYRSFIETGTWPNQTVFVLESRRSETNAAPNVGGRFQGEMLGLEAEVKDSRFPDGWAFFNFGRVPALTSAAAPLTGDAVKVCVECHTQHTAVERTFVQFYPTLLEVARRKGTLKPGF